MSGGAGFDSSVLCDGQHGKMDDLQLLTKRAVCAPDLYVSVVR